MPVIRTASLVGIPVHIRFEHKIQESPASSPRLLGDDERVHDSNPPHKKVTFDVDVDWLGAATISFSDRIEAVFNYASIYRLVTTHFHEQESLKGPLDALLDLIVSKASTDHRVIAVRASASRPNILLRGEVKVSVDWRRDPVDLPPLPTLDNLGLDEAQAKRKTRC